MRRRAILGPPGTGKTYTLIERVKKALRDGVEPERIGFFSFSKKAATEALERATRELGVDAKRFKYFRTLHSMAFLNLGLRVQEVMQPSDYEAIANALGLDLSGTKSIRSDDGELIKTNTRDDVYLSMITMARLRRVSIEQQFRQMDTWHHLDIRQLRIIDEGLRQYKREMQKYDFTDMIEQFVEMGQGPEFDLLIVDEAQDLVKLQWMMVDVLALNAEEVIYAGDDDQCIYEWMGVDASDYISRCGQDYEVLAKSYRIPNSVHRLACKISSRIKHRVPKEYEPTGHEGEVHFHYDLDQVDLSSGEWLILCRTNYLANKIASKLKEYGMLFYREGSGYSVSRKALDGVLSWTRLQSDKWVTPEEILNIKDLIKIPKKIRSEMVEDLRAFEEGRKLTSDDLFDIIGGIARLPWYEALTIPENQILYIRSVLRNGESFSEKPRVKLSTIHKAKGGEADNVVLFLNSSRAAAESRNPDAEYRTLYVGVTRARQTLHLIESNTRHSFRI